MIDVKFYFGDKCQNKVQAIKAIRAFSGDGLKESKLLVEQSFERMVSTRSNAHDPDLAMMAKNDLIKTFKMIGVIDVSNTTSYAQYKEELQEIVTAATLRGDYYVSKLLIGVLEKL